MEMNDLIEETRRIATNQHEGMDALDIDAKTPVILRDDLYSQLKTKFPDLRVEVYSKLLAKLQEEGKVEDTTNDTVTFSHTFVM